jgi:hypothetical protein
MKKKINKTVTYFLVFAIGVTTGELIDWGYFELSKEISIIDAISLFVTIFLAIYIVKVVEKETQESRLEKELYITKISDLESLLNKIEDLVDEKDVKFQKINTRIHKCRIIKSSIFSSIKESFKKNKAERFNKMKEQFSLHIYELKRKLTETSVAKTDNPDVNLIDGIVNYSDNRIQEINIITNTIKEDIFKFKAQMNNL